jgi:hypothetical protein
MRLKFLLIIVLALITVSSFAQFRKKKKKSQPAETTQPTTLSPLPQKEYAPKASRKASTGTTYESEEKYYERKEELEKTRRKNEKMLEKPQYSDPMYFGHKRPPKKHKPGKMKYCKVCGIKH